MKKLTFSLIVFLICLGCVPLNQQNVVDEDAEIDGFVSALVIDEEQFNRIALPGIYDRLKVDDLLLPTNNNVTYEGTFGGEMVYIHNCKCVRNVKIVKDKLVMTHFYGGSGSNRESTVLLWNGQYYQNTKGEYIVDVKLYSNKADIGLAGISEKKVLDVAPLQRDNATFVWINLLGYDGLIRYAY